MCSELKSTKKISIVFISWHIAQKIPFSYPVCNMLVEVCLTGAASLSLPSSRRAQTASSRPSVCLSVWSQACVEFKQQRGVALLRLCSALFSSLQLGAIIPLLCVSVMGKGPTSPLERNWQTIIWGGERQRHIVGRLHKPPQWV